MRNSALSFMSLSMWDTCNPKSFKPLWFRRRRLAESSEGCEPPSKNGDKVVMPVICSSLILHHSLLITHHSLLITEDSHGDVQVRGNGHHGRGSERLRRGGQRRGSAAENSPDGLLRDPSDRSRRQEEKRAQGAAPA